ncbi:hypothetical protein [Streptomyces sp. 2A115]
MTRVVADELVELRTAVGGIVRSLDARWRAGADCPAAVPQFGAVAAKP